MFLKIRNEIIFLKIWEVWSCRFRDKEEMSTSQNPSEHHELYLSEFGEIRLLLQAPGHCIGSWGFGVHGRGSPELITVRSLWFKEADDPQGHLSHSFNATALEEGGHCPPATGEWIACGWSFYQLCGDRGPCFCSGSTGLWFSSLCECSSCGQITDMFCSECIPP